MRAQGSVPTLRNSVSCGTVTRCGACRVNLCGPVHRVAVRTWKGKAMHQVTGPLFRSLLLLAVCVVLAGCTQVSALRRDDTPDKHAGTVRVLLMPTEITLAELTAGGLLAPRADWTEAAERNVREALKTELQGKQAELVPYVAPRDPDKLYRHTQFIKLHQAVSESILYHRNRENGFRLTTKKGKLDWTLGDSAKLLREDFNADYALFLTVQDSYASGGRALLSVVLSVLYLFPVPPGSGQYGFASLVDLHDGELEWFNRFARQTGDLRSPDAAREAMTVVLKELPL